MAVYFPAHQPTQLVGLPPLKDETYARLGEAMKAIYAEYEAARQEADQRRQQGGIFVPKGGDMTRTIRIVAHGSPAAQGSKKHVGRGVMVEMDKKLPAWRKAVEAAARAAAGPSWEPINGAVKIAGEIRLRKPATTKYPDHPAGPPDTDKLQRAIGDALTKSQVITDDARIVHWDIKKVWALDLPGMDINIIELKEAQ